MKTLLIVLAMFITTPPSIHTFKVQDIDGKNLDLKQYKGKKILIVNTASKCGYTKQYADLQKLADAYKDKLVVIGFPANNFAGQEPGVKGSDISPLFKHLTTAENPDFTGDIKWNFEKFLIDENGQLVHRFRSSVTPMSSEITKYL